MNHSHIRARVHDYGQSAGNLFFSTNSMRQIPEAAQGDMLAHVEQGANPEDARLLSEARMRGASIEELEPIAKRVAQQIAEANIAV